MSTETSHSSLFSCGFSLCDKKSPKNRTRSDSTQTLMSRNHRLHPVRITEVEVHQAVVTATDMNMTSSAPTSLWAVTFWISVRLCEVNGTSVCSQTPSPTTTTPPPSSGSVPLADVVFITDTRCSATQITAECCLVFRQSLSWCVS